MNSQARTNCTLETTCTGVKLGTEFFGGFCVLMPDEDLCYKHSAVYGHALEDGVQRRPSGEEGRVPVVDLDACQRVRVID